MITPKDACRVRSSRGPSTVSAPAQFPGSALPHSPLRSWEQRSTRCRCPDSAVGHPTWWPRDARSSMSPGISGSATRRSITWRRQKRIDRGEEAGPTAGERARAVGSDPVTVPLRGPPAARARSSRSTRARHGRPRVSRTQATFLTEVEVDALLASPDRAT